MTEEKTCIECGKSDNGITLHSGDNSANTFKYLPNDKWAHLCCYIDRSVRMSIENNLKDKE